MTEKKQSFNQKARAFVLSTRFWWAVALVYVFARIPTWLFPFDSDHWIFYYVGKHWLNGDVLYLQVWDHKAPLIFAINGGMDRLFGDSLFLHRLFITIVSVLSLWLFYLTAKRLFHACKRANATLDARIATVIFAFWANISQFTNSGNNTENFGILALLIAFYCYLRWTDKLEVKWLLYSGVGVSCIVFFKINFVILLLPLVLDFIRRSRKDFVQLVGQAAVWSLATVFQALVWFSYFSSHGLLSDWWTAMVSFNGKYLRAGWAGNLSGQLIFVAILMVAALFFAGGFYGAWKARREKDDKLIGLIAAVTVLFSIILGTFYSHYYMIVVPYLCLIAGAYWRTYRSSKFWLVLASIGLVGSLLISYKQLYNRFYGPAAEDAINMQMAADVVEAITAPSDKIFFYGYGATFYELSQRDSGSRYISASHLLIDEREGFGYDFTGKFIGDMEMSQAKYVVIDPATKDLYAENKRAMDYFDHHYHLESTVNGFELLRRNNE